MPRAALGPRPRMGLLSFSLITFLKDIHFPEGQKHV